MISTYSFSKFLTSMLMILISISFIDAQGLMLSTELHKNVNTAINSSSVKAKINVTANATDINTDQLSIIASDFIKFFGLKPASQVEYLDVLGKQAIANGLMKKKDLERVKGMIRQFRLGNFHDFRDILISLINARNKSPFNNAVSDLLNNIGQNQGNINFNHFINPNLPLDVPEIIDPNDIIDDFGIPGEDILADAIERGMAMTENWGETGKYDFLLYSSATEPTNAESMALSAVETASIGMGASLGAIIGISGGVLLAGATAGIGTPAILGAGATGAGLGAGLGAAVGETTTKVLIWAKYGNFMPICHPKPTNECIPGM